MVWSELDVDDGTVELMGLDVEQLRTGLKTLAKSKKYVPKAITYLRVVLADTAIFVSGNDMLAKITPTGDCSLALLACNLEMRLINLIVQTISSTITVPDVKHANRAEETHPLLCHCQQPAAVRTEGNALDRGRELPHLDALTRPNIPQPHRVISCTRCHQHTARAHIHRPQRTLVPIVCA